MISCNKNDGNDPDIGNGNGNGGLISSVSANFYFGMTATPWLADNPSKMFMRFSPGCGQGYLAALSGNYLVEIEMNSSSSFNTGVNYSMGPNENIRLNVKDISTGEIYTTNSQFGNGTFEIDTIGGNYIECTFSCFVLNSSNVGISIAQGKLKYGGYGPSISNSFFANVNVNTQDYFTCDPSGVFYPSESKLTIKAYASGTKDWISFDIPSYAATGDSYSLPNQNVNFNYFFKTPPAPPVSWVASGGFVNITSHDPNQKTIKGTFEFIGTHPFVYSLRITQGSFNIKYDTFPI